MAKFNVSPAAGQQQQQRVDVIDKLARVQEQAQPDLPTQPQPLDTTDPLVASLMADGELAQEDLAPAPVDMSEAFETGATLDPQQQAQREAERIAPLSERIAPVDTAVADLEPLVAQQGRAQNLLNALDYDSEGVHVKSGFVPTGKLQALQDPTAALTEEAETQAFVEPEDGPTNFVDAFMAAEAGTPVAREAGGGKFQFDPVFAWVAGAATERFFAEGKQDLKQDAQADLLDFEAVEEAQEAEAVAEDLQQSRALGNARLGRQIWEEWQREKAVMDGAPSDEYLLTKKAPSRAQLEYMGGAIKEAYAASNPDMIKRPMGTGQDNPTYFQPTDKFLKEYAKFKVAASAPFDTANEIPPLNAPPANPKAQPEFEAKLRARSEVTKIADQVDPKALNLMNEARTNLSGMGYKVDARADMMVYSMGGPAISQALQIADSIGPDELNPGDVDLYKEFWAINKVDDLYAALGIPASDVSNAKYMNVGVDRLFSIFGDKRRLLAEMEQARVELSLLQQDQEAKPWQVEKAERDFAKAEKSYNEFRPMKIYRSEIAKYADELDSLHRYSNQVSHFTFAIQMLTGRMHMQQNKLNPQSKKSQRFAIRQADAPVKVMPNRGGPIENNFKELVSVVFLGGKSQHKHTRLEAFNQADLSGYAEMGRQLTEQFGSADSASVKAALSDKNLQGLQAVPPIAIPEVVQTELNKHKIEEAPYIMELLMDIAQWENAKANGQHFYTTYEAEMDGISHGVTSNGASLGNENTMVRGGVLHTDDVRKQVSTRNDVVGDITKEMAHIMVDEGSKIVDQFANEGDRKWFTQALEIATKDRANFLKKAPMTFVYGQELKNLRQHVKSTMYTGDQATAFAPILESGVDVTQLENFLLQVMQNSLVDLLSAEAVQVSRQLRANNVLATLTGVPLYYDNAMGFRNWIGNIAQKEGGEGFFESPLGLEGGGVKNPNVQHFRDEIHGAAPRQREGGTQVGGWGHGRIIPSVVQAYDGNMIAKTSSGKSFRDGQSKAKSRGHKYGYLPVFDAFKTNLANLDIVREEANKNWWNGIQQKNFVEDIMGPDGWTADIFAMLRELAQKNEPIDVFSGQFRGVGELITDEKQMQNLVAATYPYQTKDQLTNQKMIKEHAKKVTKNIYDSLRKQGIDVGALQAETNSELPARQVVDVIRTITSAIHLFKTNGDLAKTIANKRAKAFSKVKSQALPLSQIDIG